YRQIEESLVLRRQLLLRLLIVRFREIRAWSFSTIGLRPWSMTIYFRLSHQLDISMSEAPIRSCDSTLLIVSDNCKNLIFVPYYITQGGLDCNPLLQRLLGTRAAGSSR